MEKTHLLCNPPEEWAKWIVHGGRPGFRASQLKDWIFHRFETDFQLMSNLPADFRLALDSHYKVCELCMSDSRHSADGTIKFVFKTREGHYIECVLITEGRRKSVCLSSQVGCAGGCRFCNTAKMGLIRNLTAGEILDQFLLVSRYLKFSGKTPITNVIFMGMGEPLSNVDAVSLAAQILCSGAGFHLSSRKVTVSTCGIIPEIKKLKNWAVPVKLAVSLNASNNRDRSRLMPVNRQFPLEKLISAAENYAQISRLPITYEYVMIKGINCASENARQLLTLLPRSRSKINLIALNPRSQSPLHAPTTREISKFQALLLKGGIPVILRKSKGVDISAACGQLIQQSKKAA